MSLTNIKPWFRKRMSNLYFEEHTDGFNTDDIGGLTLDRKWHFLLPSIDGGSINMSDQSTESEVLLKVFFKGGRDAADAIDNAILEIEGIIKECCNIKNRTSDGILNVVFNRAEIDERGLDNDSSVMVSLTFSVTVLIGVQE